MTQDVMLDLETLSTHANAVILSIGAVTFDLDSIGHQFYRVLDIDSNLELGRCVDGRTIAWWFDQNEEAQSAVFRSPTVVTLVTGLTDLTLWLHELDYEHIWCRGPSFDFTILKSAYQAASLAVPWPFYAECCARTLEGVVCIDKFTRSGTHHHALEDAKHQARCVMAQLRALQENRENPVRQQRSA